VRDLSEKVFETLRRDQDFVLYRGRNLGDASQILMLSPATVNPSSISLGRLEREYSLKQMLDSAWSARPLAMVHYLDRPVLLLEDPGGVPLDQLLHRGWDLISSLRLAVGLLASIECLHRTGLIHKDVKPANVLVDPVDSRCWLTGFGIASQLPRERQSAEPPEVLAGTLAYMAPEQTGRMNRSTDSRSDLYSVGVLLYEMLTGTLPFLASDPMEWVHCHIARKPVPPDERSTRVPRPVSAIVMKLLAKTGEERYQTAAGAKSDLQRCLGSLEGSRPRDPYAKRDESGTDPIPDFVLGVHDVPDRLLIPEKLYGRAREIDTLVSSFDRVATSGRSELVLLSGYAGIGKSSVVHELHKALVPPRALFASGKFDQYKRDIPYSTLAQAFQGLIRPLLGKSDSELGSWREAFQESLGPNGRLIVDLIPELALILGQPPPVPELPVQDAQRRFHLVFRRFISVFARPEHPLALFLDDLQWLDAASLDLLEDLATQPDVQYLMLIGAYRDNEVSSSHALMRKLDAIRQTGAIVQQIVLAPLRVGDLAQLIADSLHCVPEGPQYKERLIPLAHLIHGKTGGNPFFAIQFISALAEEALFTFQRSEERWSWDLDRIRAKGYTDNVVDLMLGKLSRLPVHTQKTLKELACLGNSAEITTLSLVHGGSEEAVHADLWDALRLEFIVRVDGSYRFVHDRVQEAAYSLIPEELRAEAHLRMGRRLLAQTPLERREELIFEIVNQLNRGAHLITSSDERDQLAELNLIAGRRARAATAYRSAGKCFMAGAALLASDAWARRHELAFALEFYRAECEFLTGELAAAEERLTALLSRAADTVELARVECLRIDLYTTLDQIEKAVSAGIGYLRHLGVEWSSLPTEEEARHEYERIWKKIGDRTIEELIDLPLMSDPVSLATLDVLTKVFPSALTTDANLLCMAVCRAINLSLEQGHGDASCVAYVFFGKIAGPQFGDYKAGFQFGQLGYELVEKRGLKRFQARTYLWLAQFHLTWTKHVEFARGLIQRAFEAATKNGDLTVAVYSLDNLNTNFLAAGDPLMEAQRQAEYGLELAESARFGHLIDTIKVQLGVIRTLRGLTNKFGCFDDGQFAEAQLERHFATRTATKQPGCWYWIRKLQARFFAQDYASAFDAANKARQLLWTSAAMFETAEYHFFAALARAAVYDSSFAKASEDKSAAAREEHLRALVEHHRQLALWGENCPETFENRVALVGAEIARLEGRELEAERLYEQAIHSARTNGFVHNEALANELAARFYATRGFEKIANTYLRDARYCYLRWGADGKVRQLDQLHPHIQEGAPELGGTSTIGAPFEHLDLGTVIKVSQAVSGEIVLEKLIDTLMRTAIEHAGAERGLLIFNRETKPQIEAEATTSGGAVVVRSGEHVTARDAFPDSVVQYVLRTHDSVILADASAQNPFFADDYIKRRHALSILCLPLIDQGKLTGVL
jgi:predicted ATPase